jgi:hypothetical protein
MSTSAVEMPIEVLGSTPDERPVDLGEQIIPANPVQIFDHRPRQNEIAHDTASDAVKLKRLTKKKQHWGFLEGKDAALYLRLTSVPAPAETSIDIPSLQSKLSSLLPGDKQLERRARKLAWQLSRGRRVNCEWDNVSLSELTPSENRMSDDTFVTLYPDHVSAPNKKGGRPRKYKTAAAQRKGHVERQRRYRERKVPVISEVMKTPRSLLRNKGLQTQK